MGTVVVAAASEKHIHRLHYHPIVIRLRVSVVYFSLGKKVDTHRHNVSY